MTQIILNSAKCLLCGDVLISRTQYNFVSCTCKNLSVDGGLSYTKRLVGDITAYEELSIYSDVEYKVIRESLYRGSYGLLGKEELHWIKLSEMTDNHLQNTIEWCKIHYQGDSRFIDYYLQEVEYRKQHNITIGE